MKVICDECNIEMGRKEVADHRFVSKYYCSNCGKVVTVDSSEEAYLK